MPQNPLVIANSVSDDLALTAAATLTGTEVLGVFQGSEPRQTTTQDVADLAGGGGAQVIEVETGPSVKISGMSAAGGLAGTEPVPTVQGGANVATTAQDIADLAPATYPKVTDGTTTITGAGTITVAGAVVSGTTPDAVVTVSPDLKVTDGTTTISGAGTITLSGAVVSGTTPDAVVTAVNTGTDAQTAVAGAATSAASNVVVTSEALTTASTYSLTLTDAKIKTGSVIVVSAYDSSSQPWALTSSAHSPGSAVLTFVIVPTATLTGTLVMHIAILN